MSVFLDVNDIANDYHLKVEVDVMHKSVGEEALRIGTWRDDA